MDSGIWIVSHEAVSLSRFFQVFFFSVCAIGKFEGGWLNFVFLRTFRDFALLATQMTTQDDELTR